MKIEDLNILTGENLSQRAYIEKNENMIDYETSKNLSYVDILGISKGLNVISEFFDVNAVVSVSGVKVSAVALGKSQEDALLKVIDSNPMDFISSTVICSSEIDSEFVKKLKNTNKIVAPKFTKNAIDFLETHDICYIKINTPLKDYKKYLSEEIKITTLGTLKQQPNLSELNKETFKIVSAQKPTVEQIEDAVFAWKIAKHINSQAIVVAKDLKTSAISQSLHSASVEFAIDYSCDMTKDAILASDMEITIHDLNVAAQGRVALIIVPQANSELIKLANKYGIIVITTGFTNILY